MKPTSKMSVVASSPGRAEKLPAPPFSRLLKGKTASRSRRSSSSSSRASPMFVVRRRSAAGEGEGEKEPGSPKVTCIGQVRIHKKKKKKKTMMVMDNNKMDNNNNKAGGGDDHNKNQHQRQTSSSYCDCRCFHRPDFCNPFTKLPQTKRSRAPTPQQPTEDNQHQRHRRRLWRAWFSPRCCQSSSNRCHRESKDQKQLLQNPTPTPTTATTGEDQEPPVQRTKPRVSFACSPVRRDWMSKVAADADGLHLEDDNDSDDPGAPSTPPKNALLLMRCRSAPQGASPFTRRFLTPEEQPDHATDDTDPDVPSPAAARSSPFFRFKTPSPDAARRAASTKSESYNNTDDAGSASEEDTDADADAAASAVGPSPSFSSVPLILTRCKSEPAHKAAKLASAQPDSADDNNGSSNGEYCTGRSKTKGNEHRGDQ